MYAVGRIGSYISRGVDTVAAPFHPFGGAVDMIVVQQADGSLKTSPWYVRFGKFQGVLKTREKVVSINVNGVDADFHMYLDHKGEAYFQHEVQVEDEEAVLYHSSSSSGEDTDKHFTSKQLTKSESFHAELKQPNLACEADGRDEYKREHGAWNSPRRARILGLVFGSRSFKEKMSQKSPEEEELRRARLLERAEIAADLLELKWSTSLATKKSKKFTFQSSPSAVTCECNSDLLLKDDRKAVSPVVLHGMEFDTDHGEIVNGTMEMGTNDEIHADTSTSVDTAEQPASLKSPMEFRVFVAQESSDSLESFGGKENDLGDDVSSGTPNGSNMIFDSNSVIGIQLVTNDSLDTEMAKVIHPTDVISKINEYNHAEMEEAESKHYSIQTSSCSSCISEEEVVEPDKSSEVDQSCNQTNSIDSSVLEEEVESSSGKGDHQHQNDIAISNAESMSLQMPSVCSDQDQFASSDLDDSKLRQVNYAESTSVHCYSGSVYRGTESPKRIDKFQNLADKSFSYSENPGQENKPDCLEEHSAVSIGTQKQDDESNLQVADFPQKNLSTSDATEVSQELQCACASELDVSDKTWGIWPFTFKRSRSMKISTQESTSPKKSLSPYNSSRTRKGDADDIKRKPRINKKKVKTVTPTTEQLASLNLKEGRNEVTFTFSTAMLGDQQVDARIYVWKWNARIVISDVDGTITRSDVLGQVMPLVGMDWSHIGVTQLFSAIKENGYQLLFLSARAISQAYHTRQFLFNLKQNGQALPDGPVVISPDGLFPSLFREVIRRAPHEFKIACLEDIKACFPPDSNPFYAGFGNRDTDEFSYLKVGIPKGKIFIINPKGEVAVQRRLDTKSYTSLHSLVNGIFPPTSATEQEDYNSWNFWKLPPPTL